MISETSKLREQLLPFCEGYGVDLGFGGDKIKPEAIAIDKPNPLLHAGTEQVQLGGDATDLVWFKNNTLDYVYSSHLLEDFDNTITVLKEWVRVIKIGGNLVLNLPDDKVFLEHCKTTGQAYNFDHKCKDMSLDFIKNLISESFGDELELVHEVPLSNVYCFGVVYKKKSNPKNKELTITYVVPSYKRLDLLENCLKSIRKYSKAEIIVCDDASPNDEKLESLKLAYKYNALFLSGVHNQGFGYNSNKGLYRANTDLICLVNTDIEMVMDIEESTKEQFSKDLDLAIMGYKLLYPDGKIQHGGIRFMSQKDIQLHYNDPAISDVSKYIFAVSGALITLRREAIEDLGGFKREYYIGSEDIELCLRAWNNNFSVYYNAQVTAIHYEGKTRGINKEQKIKTNTYEKEKETYELFKKDFAEYDIIDIQNKVMERNGIRTQQKVKVGFLRDGALGDCILLNGVIKSYAIQNPSHEIYVCTQVTYPFEANPYVSKIFKSLDDMNKVGIETLYDFNLASEKDNKTPVWEAYSKVIGISCLDKPFLSLLDPYKRNAMDVLNIKPTDKKLAIIHPAVTWEAKTVSRGVWLEVVEELKKLNFYVVQVGTAGHDLDVFNCDLNLQSKVDLDCIRALCDHADLFVGIDSGLLHIAQCTNIPLVGIFTVANPGLFIHRDSKAVAVIPEIECQFCRNKTEEVVTYIACTRLDCLKEITSDKIIRKVKEVL